MVAHWRQCQPHARASRHIRAAGRTAGMRSAVQHRMSGQVRSRFASLMPSARPRNRCCRSYSWEAQHSTPRRSLTCHATSASRLASLMPSARLQSRCRRLYSWAALGRRWRGRRSRQNCTRRWGQMGRQVLPLTEGRGTGTGCRSADHNPHSTHTPPTPQPNHQHHRPPSKALTPDRSGACGRSSWPGSRPPLSQACGGTIGYARPQQTPTGGRVGGCGGTGGGGEISTAACGMPPAVILQVLGCWSAAAVAGSRKHQGPTGSQNAVARAGRPPTHTDV